MPAALVALTPREVGMIAEGHAMRNELTTYRMAWLAAQLLQPHAARGRTLRPEDFLAPNSLKYCKPKTPQFPATRLAHLLGET